MRTVEDACPYIKVRTSVTALRHCLKNPQGNDSLDLHDRAYG